MLLVDSVISHALAVFFFNHLPPLAVVSHLPHQKTLTRKTFQSYIIEKLESEAIRAKGRRGTIRKLH